MLTSSLQHICYTQLNPMTWCATAQLIQSLSPSICSRPLAPSVLHAHSVTLYSLFYTLEWRFYNANNPNQHLSARQIAQDKRQQQRKGVRLLLQNLLTTLNINDKLNEEKFPYCLINSGYYVCFSHSTNKVAVIINERRAVGIDIETQDIAWHVAQRFYHPNEIALLTALPLEQRLVISKWLWQLKESFIKIYHYKLAQGLGMNYGTVISDLTANLSKDSLNKDSSTVTVVNNNKSSYQIAILACQQTLAVF